MSADDAAWPYDKVESLPGTTDPTWTCPEGDCTCDTGEKPAEKLEFSVMLCKPSGERMPGVRCRVVVNGILVSADTPNADGQGWITVLIKHATESVWVEWAPPDTPQGNDYPYRRRYYVDLADGDLKESTKRRLHNLGFSILDTLTDNVKDFQYQYDYPALTGDPEEIQDKLVLYHDQAMVPEQRQLPVRDRAAGIGQPQGQADIQLAKFPPPSDAKGDAPQPAPAPPASKGGQKTGNAQGQGTIKLVSSPMSRLPSVVDLIDSGEGLYNFMPITATNGTAKGVFWVFVDALTDKLGRRIPCSAAEAQQAADHLKVASSSLREWDGSSESELPCVLLTPKLMDIRWDYCDKAGMSIDPCPQNIKGLIVAENAKMNACVESHVTNPADAVADPGKIWALSNRLGDKIGVLDRAINYGWHVQPAKVVGGYWHGVRVYDAVTRGQLLLQSEGGAHDAYHIDYSQILLLVAGWCRITKPGETTATTMKVTDVYKDQTLSKLCTHDGPLKLVSQPFNKTLSDTVKDRFWENEKRRYHAERIQDDGPQQQRTA
jgi:hypothetical protein